MTPTLPKRLEEVLAAHDRRREKILALAPAVRDAEEYGLTFHVWDEHVTLFPKADQVDAAIRWATSKGYKLRKPPTRLTEGSAALSWDFGTLHIFVTIGDEPAPGTSCRAVQVGTRMQEVPVYEIQCNATDDPLQAYARAIQEREGGTV